MIWLVALYNDEIPISLQWLFQQVRHVSQIPQSSFGHLLDIWPVKWPERPVWVPSCVLGRLKLSQGKRSTWLCTTSLGPEHKLKNWRLTKADQIFVINLLLSRKMNMSELSQSVKGQKDWPLPTRPLLMWSKLLWWPERIIMYNSCSIMKVSGRVRNTFGAIMTVEIGLNQKWVHHYLNSHLFFFQFLFLIFSLIQLWDAQTPRFRPQWHSNEMVKRQQWLAVTTVEPGSWSVKRWSGLEILEIAHHLVRHIFSSSLAHFNGVYNLYVHLLYHLFSVDHCDEKGVFGCSKFPYSEYSIV